jgi:integrase
VAQRGSVFQRSNGRWIASLRVGTRTIQRYGTSRADAEAKLAALLKEHYQGTLVAPTKTTLAEWVEHWLNERELRPSSIKVYRETLAPVVADIGSYRLDKLSAVLLSLTFTKLAKRGMGARRRQLAHGYLKSCLGRAVEFEVLGRNPMLKVKRPEWMPKPRTYWTPEQTVRFIEVCAASRLRWAPLFIVLATCGLRVSEALALRRGDVDEVGRMLHVRRALVWAGNEYTDGDVKTWSSIRSLSLLAAAVRAFESFGLPDDVDAPIYRTAKGEPPSPSQLQRPLKALCTSASVPYVNVHGLRHVHAALVYRSTRDVYAVKARLGHADVGFTMRQYGYGTGSDRDTAAAVDELLGGSGVE